MKIMKSKRQETIERQELQARIDAYNQDPS